MITYYLDTTLATGLNDGSSAANAWQTWVACRDFLNTNHANLITAQERVDVVVLSSTTFTGSMGTLTIASDPTYFIRFIANATSAEWGGVAPRWTLNSASSSLGFFVLTSPASTRFYMEFEGIHFRLQMNYAGSSEVAWFAPTTNSRLSGAPFNPTVFRNCYIKCDPHTGTGIKSFYRLDRTNNHIVFHNTIFEDFTQNSTGLLYIVRVLNSVPGYLPIVNCTFINCNRFLRNRGSTYAWSQPIINCLFYNSTAEVTFSSGAFTGRCGKNAITTAEVLPGNDNQNNVTVDFVSATNRQLVAANDWGAGPMHGHYGAWVPAADTLGTPRLGFTTDVGAHQVGTRVDEYDYNYGVGLPVVEYYYAGGQQSGNTTGHSAADAFRFFSQVRDKINVDHPNLVTSAQTVKVLFVGPALANVASTVTFTSVCSQAYPLIFEVPEAYRSPGVFDPTKPGLNILAGGLISVTSTPTQGVRVEGLQITGDQTHQCFRIDAPSSGRADWVFRDCYVKDRQNLGSGDLGAVLNLGSPGVDNIPGTLTSHNNIFENFLGVEPNACQVYRWPSNSGDGLVFRSSNDVFINIPLRVAQTGSAASMSWLNGIWLDTRRPPSGGRITYATAGLSGYNITNWLYSETVAAGQTSLPGTVGNLYEVDIEADLFVSPTNRNLKANNDYGIGPANADTTRGALVAQYDFRGTERTGTTTDVGPHLFVAEGPPPTPGLITPTAASITETTATIGCTLDSADGTLWAIVTDFNSVPTAAQIKAGLDEGGAVAAWAGSNALLVLGANTFNATGLIEGTQYYTYFIQNNGTVDSNILAGSFQTQAAAGLPAVLDTATTVNIGQMSAVLRVSSDTNTGTLHWFLSTSATPPSAANLKAGTGSEQYGDATPPALGVNSFALTGLTPATTYHSYFIQETVDGDSNIVTASFQTATDVEPPPPPPPPDDLIGLLQVWTGTAWFPINS